MFKPVPLGNDFFDCHEQLSAKYDRFQSACILGSGPNALKGLKKIPKDCLIIALNKAILINLARDVDVWIALASQYPGNPWWNGAVKRKRKMRTTAFYSNSLIRRGNQRKTEISFNYRYSVKPPLTINDYEPMWARLRTGATVAAVALQWCYWLNIADIYLCGVDMSGGRYYDGRPVRRKSPGDTWPWRGIVDNLIGWMGQQGYTVQSLSPTKLKVPVI